MINFAWLQSETPLKRKLIFKYNLLEWCTGYQFRWHMPPAQKPKAILTFDDGPLPNTPTILEILHHYHLQAWFFMVGSRMLAHPDIVNKVLSHGHVICSHAFHHGFAKNLSLVAFIQDVQKSMAVLKDMTGSSPKIFRPPNGSLNYLQIAWLLSKGFKIFYWSHQWFDDLIESWPSILPAAPIVLLHDYDSNEAVEKGVNFVIEYNKKYME